jgi:hypothetical protein
MPRIPYARGAYRRVDMPALRCVNQYVERTPGEEDGFVLLGRPGLARETTLGSQPIRGMLSQPGAFSGDIFTVSGNALFRGSVSLGAISGLTLVDMAASPTQLMIATGATLHVSDGAVVTSSAFPDGAGVQAVAYLAGYCLAARAGSRRVYFSFDAETFDGLDYFAAEQDTGDVVGLAVVQELLWVFCERVTEVFSPTGNADAPFQRLSGRFYDKGCLDRNTIAKGDNSVFWVTNEKFVARADASPQRVSQGGIDERIAATAAGEFSAWQWSWKGHSFYSLRTAEGSFTYDAAENEWHESASLGFDAWRAWIGIEREGEVLAGDSEEGVIWRLDDTVLADDGVEIERRVTAFTGRGLVRNIVVDAAVGESASYVTAPVMEMRISRDDGATFGAWRSRSMGVQGKRRTRLVWLRGGLSDTRGVIEFRVTDETPWRLSDILANERLGGRGRG